MPKSLRGGARAGTGRKKLPPDQKPIPANLWLPAGELEAFKLVVPEAKKRNQLLREWVRAYCISKGESDRLLAQSPIIGRILSYLEKREDEVADELAEELFSLLVQRDSGAIALEDKAIVVGDSIIL